MKLIIAGTRTLNPTIDDINKYLQMHNLSNAKFEVVSGKAMGVDTSGEKFARYYNLKVHDFPADWERFGRAAGPIRNRQMAEFSDALLLIWDGKSKGSMNMKTLMTNIGKSVYEVILK